MSLPHIAWIGTGVMGRSMAGHLLAAGHPLTVFSRTRERAAALLEAGAAWAPTPADAVARAEVACVMVGHPSDVEEVHYGPRGILTAERSPGLLIDLSLIHI